MTDTFGYPFLPTLPPELDRLGWFAILLLAATLAGEAVNRWLRLPRILGYVAVGMLLGPHGLGALDVGSLGRMRVFFDVALGLVLFELGHRIDLGWLRRNPWLPASSLLEAGLSFVAIYLALLAFGVAAMHATAAAALGMATSPAVLVQLTRELKSQGQVSERLLMLCALNSVYSVVAFSMWLAWLHLEYRGGVLAMVLHPLYLIAGSIALAAAGAAASRWLFSWMQRRPAAELLLFLGLILLLVALSRALELSVLLSLVAFGVLVKNLDPRMQVLPREFGVATSAFVVLLFVLTGASLNLGLLTAGGLLAALAYVAARCIAKVAATVALARPSGISLRKGALVGIGLVPQSGLALVIAQDVSSFYPEFGSTLAGIVLGAVLVLEFAGPVATQLALQQAGETAAN